MIMVGSRPPTTRTKLGTTQQEAPMRTTKIDNTRHIGRRNRAVIRDRIAKRDYALAVRGY